jgi:hypothetical protein
MATSNRCNRRTFQLVTAALALAWCSGAWAEPGALAPRTPARNQRLHQQPRPASAPTAPGGYAVELTGTIEPFPIPRQPRPASAAPRRLDAILSSPPNGN